MHSGDEAQSCLLRPFTTLAILFNTTPPSPLPCVVALSRVQHHTASAVRGEGGGQAVGHAANDRRGHQGARAGVCAVQRPSQGGRCLVGLSVFLDTIALDDVHFIVRG